MPQATIRNVQVLLIEQVDPGCEGVYCSLDYGKHTLSKNHEQPPLQRPKVP